MTILKWIIYILFVVIFLLCFYVVGKQKSIYENITIDQTSVFAKNIDTLKNANQDLNISLENLNTTYGDYISNKKTYDENIISIATLNKENVDFTKEIDDDYKKIANSIQPIMFLELNAVPINNSAPRLDNVLIDLLANKYNVILSKSSNINIVNYNGKKCLQLLNNNDYVRFSVVALLKQFSFSFWIYNDGNMNGNAPAISIMNDTDFTNNIPNSGLKVFFDNTNQVTIKYKSINQTLQELTNQIKNGWNQITFTTGEGNACIYVNGTNRKSTNQIAGPIQPIPTNYLTLPELNTSFNIGGNGFSGYIYNLRYYAVEISPNIVSYIYSVDTIS